MVSMAGSVLVLCEQCVDSLRYLILRGIATCARVDQHTLLTLQDPVYAMLPPFVKALGPVKEWFSTWFVNTFMAKYQDLSDSASIEKVCVLQGCNTCWLD